MSEPSDWPTYQIGSRDHLHAVGAIIASWNMIESALQAFIQLIFPQHMKAGIRIFELLGNDGRIKLIREELVGTLSEQENDLLNHFFKFVYICKDNRNVLAHASYPNQSSSDHLMLSRGRDRTGDSMNIMTFSISALREMADSTYSTAHFGFTLWSAINLRLSNLSWALRGVSPRFSMQLPDKPPVPRKWDQVREIPTPA